MTTRGSGSEPGPGDNSRRALGRDRLRSIVERVERLEEERAALTEDVREVYAEAKSLGFDTVILRKAVALRRKDPAERQEQEALLDLYMHALGMERKTRDDAGIGFED